MARVEFLEKPEFYATMPASWALCSQVLICTGKSVAARRVGCAGNKSDAYNVNF